MGTRIETPSIKDPGRFFIDGEWIAPSSDSVRDVVTPSTEEVFMTVALAEREDVNRAVAAARRAFDHGLWPRMKHAERGAFLRAIGEEAARRAPELGGIWVSETGVLNSLAVPLVQRSSQTYGSYADLAETFPFEERHQPQTGNVGLLLREPVGVVGAIIPWNAPLGMIASKIAPALIAGCTVILKLAPEAPGPGLVIADICDKVGLPKGVVNVLTADREVSELLVRHPDVDKITFTGSSAVGKQVGSICGARIARCTLELGGKSAGVVFDDYDVGAAARSIATYAPMMSGQVCSSLTRIIVSRHRHDALVEALAANMGAIKVGDPFAPDSGMGPLATSRQRDRVQGYLNKGRDEGAKLTVGGGRPAHLKRGFYIEPTVFAHVDNAMTIAREEIFGPILSVIPADNEQHALEIANASNFGLNASVFTEDVEKAYRAARELRSGTVGHNSWRTDFSIAFGGFKQSGIGREGGVEGLHAFLEVKTVILDAEPRHLRS